MKQATEMTRGYQIGYMVRRKLVGVCICAFVQFLLFVNSYENDIFRNISGVLFSAVNFFVVYDSAAVLGESNTKSYSRLNYNVKWAVLWGIVLCFINILLVLIVWLNWKLESPIIVLNIIFYIWQSPYMAYLIMIPKHIPVAVIVMNIIVPISASVAGYISGKKKFTISDKIHNLMFEKDKKDT